MALTGSEGAEPTRFVARALRRFAAMRARPPSTAGTHIELAAKMSVAGGLAIWVSHLLGLDFPEYSILAVVMCVHQSGTESLNLSIVRLLGTLLGIFPALLVVDVWGVNPLSIGLSVFVLALVSAIPAFRDARRLAVLVFAIGSVSFAGEIHPWIWGRLLATAIGCVMTIAISALPWPRTLEESIWAAAARRRGILRSRRTPEPNVSVAVQPCPVCSGSRTALPGRTIPTEFVAGQE